ncbi:MAG: MoxR family ATPase [Cocleimonas sp.]
MKTQNTFLQLRDHLQSQIVGQHHLIERLLIGVLTGGHILLEGLPGLAKTTAVHALASGIHASFQHIQFTPDLMPGDLTGSDIYDPKEGAFRFIEGPLFHEIVLADEINRAPPKVQSALLEAMQDHKITVGGVTRDLADLFLVMATQNPLEQSGTYPLPEAQLDRFLLHVVLDYPSPEEELLILQRDQKLHFGEDQFETKQTPLQPEIVLQARHEVSEIHVETSLEEYMVKLVGMTRNLNKIENDWADYLRAGASPRATIALLRASSALAYINGRDYVIPEDIVSVAPDALRHRIILSHNAKAAGIDANRIIERLLAEVVIP